MIQGSKSGYSNFVITGVTEYINFSSHKTLHVDRYHASKQGNEGIMTYKCFPYLKSEVMHAVIT